MLHNDLIFHVLWLVFLLFCPMFISTPPPHPSLSSSCHAPHCFQTSKALYFFDDNNNEKQDRSSDDDDSVFKQFLKIEAYTIDRKHDLDPRMDQTRHSCVSMKPYDRLHYFNHQDGKNITIPLLLTKNFVCKTYGSGNMLGFYFELLSFTQIHGIALGHVINPYDACPMNTRANLNDMMLFLPRLVIPLSPYIHPIDYTPSRLCNNLGVYVWASNTSLFWDNLPEIAYINTEMVRRFLEANNSYSFQQQPANNHNKLIKSPRTNNQLRSVASQSLQTIAIHYRCGDNLGLFPLRHYQTIFHHAMYEAIGVETFLSNITRIIIATDSDIHNPQTGELCSVAIGELTSFLQEKIPELLGVEILVEHALPVIDYVTFHTARMTVRKKNSVFFFLVLYIK